MPVVLLDGARATGKTTSARRLVRSALHLPGDLAQLAADVERTLHDAPKPLLIDEWQLAGTELLWAIKSLVDDDPSPGSFLLTGSVAPETYGPTYPLTGRGVRLQLWPMNERELAGRGSDPTWLERVLSGEHFVVGKRWPATTAEMLSTTGFPAAPISEPALWLRAYADSIAERSVEERRDPGRVGRLLRVLAELESQAVPDEHVWRSADIGRDTFLAYMRMLERTHVVQPLPAWHTDRLKRLTTYPKRQLVDAALALAVARVTPEELRRDPTLEGRYLESFVVAQLRPECDAIGAEMWHLRSKAGEREVDLVIEHHDDLVAIEIKAGTRPRPADAKHLRWFRDEMGDRVRCCIVLHRGEAAFELVDGVWALPIGSLWADPLGDARGPITNS